MAAPGTLVSFAAGTVIRSADVNADLATLRNSLLTAVFKDTGVTITGGNTWTVSQAFQGGFTVSGVATFSSGVTVASGTTVTASGASIAGAVTFTSGVTISGPLTASSTAVFAGNVTLAAALNVVGAITCNTLTVSAGFASITVTSTAGFTSPTWALSSAGGFGPVTNLAVDFGASGNRVNNAYAGAVYATTLNLENTGSSQINGTFNTMNLQVSGNVVARASGPGGGVIGLGEFTISNRFKFGGADSVVLQAATLATSATIGYVYLPTTPGTVTGTPHAETGCVPICVDTTNSRLQIFVGGVWKSVVVA